MSTRKIKDAKDLSTGELIYFKGHAQATFMSDGRTVEEAVSEESDIFILDLFGITGYPDDPMNTGAIELAVDSELMSMIDSAIQKNKLVIRVEYVDLYNLEIDAYNSTRRLIINSDFNYSSVNAHLFVSIDPSELIGSYSISTVNAGSGGSIDTSNLATKTELAQKQDTLVSGTNIKTINSTSLLGSGNIAIKDTKNLTYSLNNSTSGTVTLLPNVCIYMPNVLTGKLAINACSTISSNNADLVESRICFRMPNNASLPVIQFNGVAIRWAGGKVPTFEADFTYEVSLFYPSNANSVGPMGVCIGFK